MKRRHTLADFLHFEDDVETEERSARLGASEAEGSMSVKSGEGVTPAADAEAGTLERRLDVQIFTVGALTKYIKDVLEGDELLNDVYVRGEVSNFRQPTSGHMYFTLKDETAELECVMFRRDNVSLSFIPEDGMKVIARGSIGVYERRGRYELYVRELQKEGLGELYLEFERLKEKLKGEGLFDAARKRPLPRFPKRIGIITSPTGAAIRDMLKIIKKRYPNVHVLISPVKVQGEEASLEIANAIKFMNNVSETLLPIDVLIVGRGGGSIEELWAFNEEIVARAIYESKIPIISAVGHEIDFTIADFTADRRAATPSEAAEIVVPDMRELKKSLETLEIRLRQSISKQLEVCRKRLESVERSAVFRKPTERIDKYRQQVDELKSRLLAILSHHLELKKSMLQGIAGKLDALSPLAVFGRGFSACLRLDGRVVRSIEDVSIGDAVRILLSDGELLSEVRGKRKREN
ncbi:MAG: Exonuclease VII [Candidatus Alkanophagales archaeon MCA70_species_2]|nr:Exonuclease VII [Candidatus Alkanophaga liquidiphilum]